eukprot:scaffold319901_cov12-Tisochrysis_lutea.AAC.1
MIVAPPPPLQARLAACVTRTREAPPLAVPPSAKVYVCPLADPSLSSCLLPPTASCAHRRVKPAQEHPEVVRGKVRLAAC